MSTLSELTVQILTARLAKKEMSLEEMQKEMITISNMIKGIDDGTLAPVQATPAGEEQKSDPIDMKKVFGKDKVVCLICNNSFASLTRHLRLSHNIDPKAYKAQFNIPAKQKLVSKSLSDKARKSAVERGQGDILAKARDAKKAKKSASGTETEKA